MIRDIKEKPTNPKNGDRYEKKNGDIVVFRCGSWVEYIPEQFPKGRFS